MFLAQKSAHMYAKVIVVLLMIFSSFQLSAQTFLHSSSFNNEVFSLALENNNFIGASVKPIKNLNLSYYNSLYQAVFEYQDFTFATDYSFFSNNAVKTFATFQTFGNFGEGFKELYGGIQAEISPFKKVSVAGEYYATIDNGFKNFFQGGILANIYNEFSLFAAYGTPFFGFKNGNVLKTGVIIQTEKLAVKTNVEWQQEERMLFKRIMTGACYTIF
jgi:hypothetical protein